MDNNEIRFEGASWAKDWVYSFTSVNEFISDCPPHLCAGENRDNKLTELYTIVKDKSTEIEEPQTTKKKGNGK
jgi:hypothetical protein